MEDIMVSIICLTFNHEKYIKDALEGFINQDVNFKYEVLVHDDASTDKTAQIIREYATKYPDIIKPVYQTENQYSKGVSIISSFLLPLANGKYLAFCEGDDYWCDVHKLQKQIDFLESNNDFVVCTHNTEWILVDSYKKGAKYVFEDKELKLEDCVMRGSQSFHTSSVVVRKETYLSRPDFTKSIKSVGDYPLSIWYALCGRIYYYGRVMSTYRQGTEGSWTKRIGDNREKKQIIIEYAIKMLELADDYSNHKFHAIFSNAIDWQKYRLDIVKQNYKKVVISKKYFNQESRVNRVKYRVLAYLPFLISIRNLIRRGK